MSAERRRRAELAKRSLSTNNRVARALWNVVWVILYRPSPRALHAWRRWLLRRFGAEVGVGAHPYPSARIWAPWHLVMKDYSCLGDQVDCYSVDRVVIGRHVTVSQYSYLCTASHDFDQGDMPLVSAPIELCDQAWVAADAFIGPGVTVGEGAVVAARSTVTRNVDPWEVVGGNPARHLRFRKHVAAGVAATPDGNVGTASASSEIK